MGLFAVSWAGANLLLLPAVINTFLKNFIVSIFVLLMLF